VCYVWPKDKLETRIEFHRQRTQAFVEFFPPYAEIHMVEICCPIFPTKSFPPAKNVSVLEAGE